jgi:predicted dehydrogenase
MGELSAIAELSDSTRTEVSSKFGVTAFASHHELIDAKPEAVVIATPAHVHFSVAKDFLEAGIPCLVEKPLTLNVAEGEELVKIAKSNNVTLMVGHLLIYQPAIQFIKQQIDAGLIGTLNGLHQERLNLGKARNQENALWSLGVHDVAVALFLIGENPTKSICSGQSILNAGIEDDTYLHMEFQNGVQAHIHSSWYWPEMRRQLVVVGDTGILVFDEPNKKVIHHKKRIEQATLNNVDEGTEVVFEGDSQPLRLELEHFLECVRSGATPKSDGTSGVETLKVLASIK